MRLSIRDRMPPIVIRPLSRIDRIIIAEELVKLPPAIIQEQLLRFNPLCSFTPELLQCLKNTYNSTALLPQTLRAIDGVLDGWGIIKEAADFSL